MESELPTKRSERPPGRTAAVAEGIVDRFARLVLPDAFRAVDREEGTGLPRYKILWKEHVNVAAALLLATLAMLILAATFIAAETRVGDGDSPAEPLVGDWAWDGRVRDSAWFRELGFWGRRITDADLERGKISAHERGDDPPVDVDVDGLLDALRDACPGETCSCASALHVGLPLNVVYLPPGGGRDGPTFLFDPGVAKASEETFAAHWSDGNRHGTASRPVSSVVEFRDADGSKNRATYGRRDSACVIQCIESYRTI